ncbi:MAG: hypothetical protein K9M75_05655 [Phycisphaerae bacterium]|nr:hypothetical protein [Phycisphaerae bacterium]
MFKKFGLTGLVLMIISSGVVSAEEADGIDFGISADFVSKYIWRGQNLNDDYAFQPGVTASYAGFTAGAWGSLDMTDISGNSGEFTEIDYSLDYSGEIEGMEGLSYSVGIINYHFPGLVGDTTEVYWGLALDMPLSPSVTVYHDIDQADGTYASFGIEHSFGTIADLGGGVEVGMDFSASLGLGDEDYNNFYWGTTDGGLNDLALSMSFPFEIAGFTVAPSINYVTLVDGGIRATDSFAQSSDYFFTGFSLSKSF